jgi:hypothetical protein
MLKSIEQIARAKLNAYMRDFVIGGVVISAGWPADIAARKAAAASPNFAKEIYEIAKEMMEVNK